MLAALALLAGCSGATRADGLSAPLEESPAAHRAPRPANGAAPCEDWTPLECGIELDSHDGVVDCARGVRLCQNGAYGACIANATLGVVSVQAPGARLPLTAPTQGVMAVGGTSTDCVDDVCNPYCHTFVDEADTPYTAPRVDVPSGILSGGPLQNSNIPTSFKNKGSLNSQCSAAVGSQTWNEACQFDQHCVNGACTAWGNEEFGDCQGVDITTPTTCVPSSGGTRDLTVCNRGTVAAPAGINCYGYSGGSPKFPNSDPGTTDRLIMTTQQTLQPGACETQEVDEAIFHQNGIQSIGCNPPDTRVVTSTIVSYPGSSAATSGLLPWTSPDQGWLSDTVYASASPANPGGASSGPFSPTANASFSSDGSWSSPSKAYPNTDDGVFATAAPLAPIINAGTLGPNYPGGFTNPASAGDASFSNPDRIYSADSSYLTAAPVNPTTQTTLTRSASANSVSGWNNPAHAYTSNSVYATAKLTGAGTSDLTLSGFGLSVPTNAVLDSLAVTVKWKTDVNSVRYTLTAQAMTGAANTAIGSALVKSANYTTESSDIATVPTASLTGFSASDFSDTNFKVRVRFERSNGNVTDSTASIDHVQVVLKYHLASTTASVVYQYFGLGSIPSNAQVQLTAEVKWKSSAVNTNVTLGMQLYKKWGTASQASIGSEVTRTPVAANTNYVDTTATLTPTPTDLIDTSFAIRLRVVRSDGAANPDVTASIDYVRVTATYSTNAAATTHSVYYTGFGIDAQIPSNATITSIQTSASWKLSAPTTYATLGLQAYTSGGTTPLGTELTDTTAPTTLTTGTQTVSSGIARTDLSDANFGVRARVTRASGAVANTDFTAYLDRVSVVVNWTAPSVGHGVTYGSFGLGGGIPATATVTQLKTELRWKSSVSSNREQLGFQLFKNGVAIGSEYVDSTAPTSATTRTQTLTGLSLSAADLADGNFVVKVRSTRTTGNSNPAFTAYVDFVRVTVSYTESIDSAVAECNGSNNWTATKLNPSPDACVDMSTPQYVPFTVSRVFQATCPFGQAPSWRRFGYTTSTPDPTSVEFRFRSFRPDAAGTCSAMSAVNNGDPQPLATASATQDPAVCSTTDPGCVLDLAQYLGAAGTGLSCLQMDAYGVPGAVSSPELFDWTVLYDCKDNE